MSDIATQLRELSELHRAGTLSDAEFQAAKDKVLGSDTRPQSTSTSILALQNELAALDRGWMLEREKYKVQGRYNSRIPAPGDGTKAGFGVVIFGGIWTAVALFIASNATSIGAPPLFWIFPAFGVFIIIAGLFQSGEMGQKAEAYGRAEAQYQTKRAALEARIRALS